MTHELKMREEIQKDRAIRTKESSRIQLLIILIIPAFSKHKTDCVMKEAQTIKAS